MSLNATTERLSARDQTIAELRIMLYDARRERRDAITVLDALIVWAAGRTHIDPDLAAIVSRAEKLVTP